MGYCFALSHPSFDVRNQPIAPGFYLILGNKQIFALFIAPGLQLLESALLDKLVGERLGMTVREIVCGLAESDLRLADRLVAMKRIIESGDSAAIRAMDHGLENAQTFLDRSIGIWEKEPLLLGVGEKTIPMSVKNEGITLPELQVRSASKTEAMSVPSSRVPGIQPNTKMGIRTMNGYRLNDAPELPVGNAIKIALPKSNRPEEHHENSSEFAARADSESTRR
jgi:hypothetical protein